MTTAIIEILASLGLFLFGMIFLEARIKAVAGRSFKKMLNNATRTNTRSLTLGITATTIFQSSSIVSLMTLSFIGAGTLSLQNGIGIILGSNLGTTFTSWLIAVIGFKMDIKLIAYIFIAVGGIGSIFGNGHNRWKHYFAGMVGFGLIFLGLAGMKDSFSFLAQDFDLSHYKLLNPYFFLLIGLIVTAIIQSSSASIAIAQSALFTQIISFEMAALFVIGANIGTTVTVLLGSLGGSPDKKRAAMVHLLFNFSTGLLAIVLLIPLSWLTFSIIPPTEAVIALALFHTFFNLLGVGSWFFFIPKLAHYLQKKFTKEPILVTRYIHNIPPKVPVVAMLSLEEEIRRLARKVSDFALFSINIVPPQAVGQHQAIDKLLDRSTEPLDISYMKLYSYLQELEGEILDYTSDISLHVSKHEQEQLNRLLSITTYLASASKSIKDMLADFTVWTELEDSEAQRFFHNIRYQILNSILIFSDYLNGEEEQLSTMKKNYQKIDASYKRTLESIASIAQNTHLSKTITTIAINDIHLTRNFTKSLYNTLKAFDQEIAQELSELEIDKEVSESSEQ